MKKRFLQFRSVLVMESILRLRRTSTLVLFLFMCAAAFMLMPEAGSGGTTFLIDERRVLLNSAAASLATAMLGGMIFSLAGFYLVSNSIARDVRTGVGSLVASTPVSSARYLAGKLFGNILYLSIIGAVFMTACMGMHLLRGEMPLEPVVYFRTFGIMFLPLIPVVASIALMFESVPLLSGRGGDALYFFIWTLSIGLSAAIVMGTKGRAWLLSTDISGIGFFIREIETTIKTTSVSIGYATFDRTLPPILFPGLKWIPDIVVPRLISAVIAFPLFGIAWVSFRRFDPAKKGMRTKTGLFSRIQQKIGRSWFHIPKVGWPAGSASFLKGVLLDFRMTLVLSPVVLAVIALSSVACLFAPVEVIRATLLPIAFFVLVPLLASIPTRDRAANATELIFSAPIVRQNFVSIKFLSALLTAALVCLVPLIRIGPDSPFGALELLNGMLFLAAGATILGVLTNTPKTFTAVFLLFLYVAMSSRGVPGFDFAGWHMIGTAAVAASYAMVSVLMMSTAWWTDWMRMGKERR